ncbi:hypothetical protein CSUI_009130 [Cystoisospora suis]|uniref:Uncharacterized protein n=1 Tax=Cystoisospora suis TaxID=483139 RepID=A0A2C6JJ96_9APIC|nr:hypothetical protein CSUI_009130 [Cystoisospora suis]
MLHANQPEKGDVHAAEAPSHVGLQIQGEVEEKAVTGIPVTDRGRPEPQEHDLREGGGDSKVEVADELHAAEEESEVSRTPRHPDTDSSECRPQAQNNSVCMRDKATQSTGQASCEPRRDVVPKASQSCRTASGPRSRPSSAAVNHALTHQKRPDRGSTSSSPRNLPGSPCGPPVLPFCLPLCISMYFDPFARTQSFPHCSSCSQQRLSGPADSVCCCGLPLTPPPLCTPPCPFPFLSSPSSSSSSVPPSFRRTNRIFMSSSLSSRHSVGGLSETKAESGSLLPVLPTPRERSKESTSSSSLSSALSADHSRQQASGPDGSFRADTSAIQRSSSKHECGGQSLADSAGSPDAFCRAPCHLTPTQSTPSEGVITSLKPQSGSKCEASHYVALVESIPEKDLGCSATTELTRCLPVCSPETRARLKRDTRMAAKSSVGPGTPQEKGCAEASCPLSPDIRDKETQGSVGRKHPSACAVAKEDLASTADHAKETVFVRILPLLQACAQTLLAFVGADDGRLYRWKQVFGSLQFGVRAFLNAPEVIYCRGVTRLAQQRLLSHTVHMLFVWIFLAVAAERDVVEDRNTSRQSRSREGRLDGCARHGESSTEPEKSPVEEVAVPHQECNEEGKGEETVRDPCRLNPEVGTEGKPHGSAWVAKNCPEQIKGKKQEKTRRAPLLKPQRVGGWSETKAGKKKRIEGQGGKVHSDLRITVLSGSGQQKGSTKVSAPSQRSQISSTSQRGGRSNACEPRLAALGSKRMTGNTATSTSVKSESARSNKSITAGPKKERNSSAPPLHAKGSARGKEQDSRATANVGIEPTDKGTVGREATREREGSLHREGLGRRGGRANARAGNDNKRRTATASSGSGVMAKGKPGRKPRGNETGQRTPVGPPGRKRQMYRAAEEVVTCEGHSTTSMHTPEKTEQPVPVSASKPTVPTGARTTSLQAQIAGYDKSELPSESDMNFSCIVNSKTHCYTQHWQGLANPEKGGRRNFDHRLVVDAWDDTEIRSYLPIPIPISLRTAKESSNADFLGDDSQTSASSPSTQLLCCNSTDLLEDSPGGRREHGAKIKDQTDTDETYACDGAAVFPSSETRTSSKEIKTSSGQVADAPPRESLQAQMKTEESIRRSLQGFDNVASSVPVASSLQRDADRLGVERKAGKAPTAVFGARAVSENETMIKTEDVSEPDSAALATQELPASSQPEAAPDNATGLHLADCSSAARRSTNHAEDICTPSGASDSGSETCVVIDPRGDGCSTVQAEEISQPLPLARDATETLSSVLFQASYEIAAAEAGSCSSPDPDICQHVEERSGSLDEAGSPPAGAQKAGSDKCPVASAQEPPDCVATLEPGSVSPTSGRADARTSRVVSVTLGRTAELSLKPCTVEKAGLAQREQDNIMPSACLKCSPPVFMTKKFSCPGSEVASRTGLGDRSFAGGKLGPSVQATVPTSLSESRDSSRGPTALFSEQLNTSRAASQSRTQDSACVPYIPEDTPIPNPSSASPSRSTSPMRRETEAPAHSLRKTGHSNDDADKVQLSSKNRHCAVPVTSDLRLAGIVPVDEGILMEKMLRLSTRDVGEEQEVSTSAAAANTHTKDETHPGSSSNCSSVEAEKVAGRDGEKSGRDTRLQDKFRLLYCRSQGLGRCAGSSTPERIGEREQLPASKSCKEDSCTVTPRKTKKAETEDGSSSTRSLSSSFTDDTWDNRRASEHFVKEKPGDEIGAADAECTAHASTQCSTASSTPPPSVCQQNKKRRIILKSFEPQRGKVEHHTALESLQSQEQQPQDKNQHIAGGKALEHREDRPSGTCADTVVIRRYSYPSDTAKNGQATEFSVLKLDVSKPSRSSDLFSLESRETKGHRDPSPAEQGEKTSPEWPTSATSSLTEDGMDHALLDFTSRTQDCKNSKSLSVPRDSKDSNDSCLGQQAVSSILSQNEGRSAPTEDIANRAKGRTCEGLASALRADKEVSDTFDLSSEPNPKKRRVTEAGENTASAEELKDKLDKCSGNGDFASQVSQQLCKARGYLRQRADEKEGNAYVLRSSESDKQVEGQEECSVTQLLGAGKEEQPHADGRSVTSYGSTDALPVNAAETHPTVSHQIDALEKEDAQPLSLAIPGLEKDKFGQTPERSVALSLSGRANAEDNDSKKKDIESLVANGEESSKSNEQTSPSKPPEGESEGLHADKTAGDFTLGNQEETASTESETPGIVNASMTSESSPYGEESVQPATSDDGKGSEHDKRASGSIKYEGSEGTKSSSENIGASIKIFAPPKDSIPPGIKNLGIRGRPAPLLGDWCFRRLSPTHSPCYSLSPSSTSSLPEASFREHSISSSFRGPSSPAHSARDVLEEWITYYRRWMGDRRTDNPAKEALLQHAETLLPDTLLVGFLQLISHVTQRTRDFIRAEAEGKMTRERDVEEKKDRTTSKERSFSNSSTDKATLDQMHGRPTPQSEPSREPHAGCSSSSCSSSSLSESRDALPSFCGTSSLAAEAALTTEALCRLLVGPTDPFMLSQRRKRLLQKSESRVSPYPSTGTSSASLSPCSNVSTSSVYGGGTGCSSAPFAALPLFPSTDNQSVNLLAIDDPLHTILSLGSRSNRSRSSFRGCLSLTPSVTPKSVSGVCSRRTSEPVHSPSTESKSKGLRPASSQEPQFPLLRCYQAKMEIKQEGCFQHSLECPMTESRTINIMEKPNTPKDEKAKNQRAQRHSQEETRKHQKDEVPGPQGNKTTKLLTLERRARKGTGGSPSVLSPASCMERNKVHKGLSRSLPTSPLGVRSGPTSPSLAVVEPSSLCASSFCKSSSYEERLRLCKQLRELVVEFTCVTGRLAAVHMDHRRCCILRCRDLKAASRALDFCWHSKPSIQSLASLQNSRPPPHRRSVEETSDLRNTRHHRHHLEGEGHPHGGHCQTLSCASEEMQERSDSRQKVKSGREGVKELRVEETNSRTHLSRRQGVSWQNQKAKKEATPPEKVDRGTGVAVQNDTPLKQEGISLNETGQVTSTSSSGRLPPACSESPNSCARDGDTSDASETDDSFVPCSSSEDEDEEEEKDQQQSKWGVRQGTSPSVGVVASSSLTAHACTLVSSSSCSPSSSPPSGSDPSLCKPLLYRGDSCYTTSSSGSSLSSSLESIPLVRIPMGGSSDACEETSYLGSGRQGTPASLSIAEYLQLIAGCGCGCGDSDIAAEDFSGTEDDFLTTEDEEKFSSATASEDEDEDADKEAGEQENSDEASSKKQHRDT